jgi:hypothetical protein
MSNPYDFTSGFLTAKSLIETERKNKADEKFRQEVMGPYYQSAAEENRGKGRYYGILGRNAIIEGNVKRARGIDMLGWDPLSDYSDDNPFGFTYTPTTPSQVDPANPAGGVKKVPAYKNGTPGGIDLSGTSSGVIQDDSQQQGDIVLADASSVNQRRQAIAGKAVVSDSAPVVSSSSAVAAPVESSAVQSSSMRDPANILKDQDPKAANAIAMNFFTAPMKDIPKMLDKVSKWDLFEGKISSKDVLANVSAMRTMQAEGVAEAMSFMLQGNKQAALKAFANVGSDLGEGVADLKPIKIKNPVASVIKGVKDEYDGVQIIYKDGHTMDWDPRKFLISTASLKEYLSSKDTVENNMRQQAASKYGDDVRAETNRLSAQQHADQMRIRSEDLAIGRITNEAKSELSRQTNAFLDPKNPNFIADDKAREIKNTQIESSIRPMMDIAIQNVTLFGNRGATVNGVMQAVSSQQPAIGSDGKPIVEVKGGQKFVKMVGGVWLPVTDQAK